LKSTKKISEKGRLFSNVMKKSIWALGKEHTGGWGTSTNNSSAEVGVTWGEKKKKTINDVQKGAYGLASRSNHRRWRILTDCYPHSLTYLLLKGDTDFETTKGWRTVSFQNKEKMQWGALKADKY